MNYVKKVTMTYLEVVGLYNALTELCNLKTDLWYQLLRNKNFVSGPYKEYIEMEKTIVGPHNEKVLKARESGTPQSKLMKEMDEVNKKVKKIQQTEVKVKVYEIPWSYLYVDNDETKEMKPAFKEIKPAVIEPLLDRIFINQPEDDQSPVTEEKKKA